MRYLRKFKGDQITADDLMPVSLQGLSLQLPEMQQSKTIKTRLEDLPIRVKTRFRGGRNNNGRRVVSTPIFDLVTPGVDLNQLPNLHTSNSSQSTSSASSSPRLTLLPAVSIKSKTIKRDLPPLPKLRQVSMPLEMDMAPQGSLSDNVLDEYESIIDVYKVHAPFGNVSQNSHLHHSSYGSTLSSVQETDFSSALSTSSETESVFSFFDADELIKYSPPSQESTAPQPDDFYARMKLVASANGPPVPKTLKIPPKLTVPLASKNILPPPCFNVTPYQSSECQKVPNASPCPVSTPNTTTHTQVCPTQNPKISTPRRKPPPKSYTEEELNRLSQNQPVRPLYRCSAPVQRVIAHPTGNIYAPS